MIDIYVRDGHPLDLVCGILEMIGADDLFRKNVYLHISEEAYLVLRESAFLNVEFLEIDGRIQIDKTNTRHVALSLRCGGVSCEIDDSGNSGYERCRDFFGKICVSTAILDVYYSNFKRREELIMATRTKAAILIGTGPSLSRWDLRDYSGALTIGCNKLHLLPYTFKTTHLVFEDRVVTEDVFASRADLCCQNIWLPHDLGHLNSSAIRYSLDRHVTKFPSFSRSPSVVFSGWTVMFVMLQIVYWMDVEEIYLVGVDGSFREPDYVCEGGIRTSTGSDPNHFTPEYYGPGQRYQKGDEARVLMSYDLAKKTFENSGRRIFNCSPESIISIFPRKTLPPPVYFS